MARDPYNIFRMRQFSYLKTNKEVKKGLICVVFFGKFSSSCEHIILLNLVNASKMTKGIMLTEIMTKLILT